jgi:hypothetical protein
MPGAVPAGEYWPNVGPARLYSRTSSVVSCQEPRSVVPLIDRAGGCHPDSRRRDRTWRAVAPGSGTLRANWDSQRVEKDSSAEWFVESAGDPRTDAHQVDGGAWRYGLARGNRLPDDERRVFYELSVMELRQRATEGREVDRAVISVDEGCG